jgi:protein involved in polysaccharide export with SLBB domain
MKTCKALAVVIILGILFLFNPASDVYAQITTNTDLSSVKVDDLTDAQVLEFMNKASMSGLSETELEATAEAQGMPVSEISKLKTRIAKIKSSPDLQEDNTDQINNDNTSPIIDNDNTAVSTNKNIFGFSLFTTTTLSFEPSTNIATPLNYQLGPSDNLVIDIWGASQETYNQKITAEGNIIISNLGPIYLSGMTIEEATVKIKKELSSIYSGLYTGDTFLKVSLSSVRSIKVNIVGDVAVPGTYTLSSLATVFNAMYVAGGPSENGSLRDIKIIRDNKTVAELDFYEFLLKGILPDNMRLQDEDIIFISSYTKRVEIKGRVKRAGVFDIKPNETLKDLIYFAGDYTGSAYTDGLKVIRKTGKQYKIFDVTEIERDSFKLVNGDEITVGEILDKYENRVEISGAIWRPGAFAIDSGVTTLQQIILKAEGLRGDAFIKRITIYRKLEDLSSEVISLDISDTSEARKFIMQKDDKVVIASINDIQEEYKLSILGQVKNPGEYEYTENTTIEDLILRAGGLLESASCTQLEVSRRIIDYTSLTEADKLSEIFTFNIDKNLGLSDSVSKFILKPFDEIFVRKSPAFSSQELIEVKGEVLLPGFYSLSQKGERISDVLKRCGSITSEAYLKGARLVRKLSDDKKMQLQDIEKLKNQSNDSIEIDYGFRSSSTISIDLEKIMKKPGSKHDLFLKEGDILYIPKIPQTVGLNGALLYPVVTRFIPNAGVRKYVSNSGGYSENASRSKTYVVYYNGSVKRTHKILFFNNYPSVEPGAEIIVPTKVKRERSNTDAVGIGSAVASFAMMVIYLINAIKN